MYLGNSLMGYHAGSANFCLFCYLVEKFKTFQPQKFSRFSKLYRNKNITLHLTLSDNPQKNKSLNRLQTVRKKRSMRRKQKRKKSTMTFVFIFIFFSFSLARDWLKYVLGKLCLISSGYNPSQKKHTRNISRLMKERWC